METSRASRPCICPNCGKEYICPEGQGRPAFFPFCCERCQWIDLGKWLTGQYRISEDLPPGDAQDEKK
jgi:endogenous inhibitor of DNA gyrase (YacG/DUF329 family)